MEHQRIDEGTQRPSKPQPPIVRAREGESWTIPDNLDADQILVEYLSAATTSGIALKYGIRRGALTRWLSQQRPEQWREVQRIRALCTKEEGLELIYDARTALQLARARELVRASQFDLQAIDPDYQPKQHLTIEHVGDLGERLRRADARIIEHEPAIAAQQLPQTAQESGNNEVIPIKSTTSGLT